MRHEGRALRLTKAHKRKAGEGEGIGSLSNNLVYTKRQKDIYANRKHETTNLVMMSTDETKILGLFLRVYLDRHFGATCRIDCSHELVGSKNAVRVRREVLKM